MRSAVEASPERPVLVDRFLEDATEIDVDVISDGEISVVGAIMEHIEQAGIHSGDSACVIPPFSISDKIKEEISTASKALAKKLQVKGLMNIQFAVKNEELFVIEVNPRASRTVPFVSKTIGVPLAKLAAKVMAGEKLTDLGFTKEVTPDHYAVKEAVFPFVKFPGTDIVLGPEMKATGEVMGIDSDLGMAYAKSQMAASCPLPLGGNVFISLKDRDKDKAKKIIKEYHELGFKLFSTEGTAKAIKDEEIPVTQLFKLAEKRRPNVLDMIKNGEIDFVINTTSGDRNPRADEVTIRSSAVANGIPVMTNLSAAKASCMAIRSLKSLDLKVKTLQEFHIG
jgi:carbamoyl-phosphate synthase large subunit